MKTLAAALLCGAMMVPLPAHASVAPASASTPVHTSTTRSQVDPLKYIAQAKKKDPKGFAKRVALLKQSDAMSELLRGADTKSAQQYWEFFAAISTDKSAADFVKKTHGKRYMVRGSESAPTVTLVDASKVVTASGLPTCWRGWVAAYAWFASEGAICGGIGAVSVPGGVVCGGVFFVWGMLPDFNAPCRH